MIHVKKMIKGTHKSPLKSRANNEGFTILKNGAVMFIPENENRVDSLIEQYRPILEDG